MCYITFILFCFSLEYYPRNLSRALPFSVEWGHVIFKAFDSLDPQEAQEFRGCIFSFDLNEAELDNLAFQARTGNYINS